MGSGDVIFLYDARMAEDVLKEMCVWGHMKLLNGTPRRRYTITIFIIFENI